MGNLFEIVIPDSTLFHPGYATFVYEKISHIIDIHKIFPYKNSLGFTELGNKGTKMIEHRSPTIAHLLTYVQTTLVMNPKKAKPAMGYEGPDLDNEFINHLKNSGKLNSHRTTKWIWEHSHMKKPNDQIFEHIHKEIIMNRKKGIKYFGLYEDF